VVAVDRDRAGVAQAEAREPVARQLAPEVAVAREQRVAGAPLAPGERLELARLLERVDADLRVGPDRDPDARIAVGERGEVAVA
jgi:hypothetical protein